jgi:hypothetical protein
MAKNPEASLEHLQRMQKHVQVGLARFLQMKDEELEKARKHLVELEKTEAGLRAHTSALARVLHAAIESGETDSKAYERDEDDYQRTLVALAQNLQGQQLMRETIAVGMIGDDEKILGG